MRILQAVNHVESTILSARHSVSTSGASRGRVATLELVGPKRPNIHPLTTAWMCASS